MKVRSHLSIRNQTKSALCRSPRIPGTSFSGLLPASALMTPPIWRSRSCPPSSLEDQLRDLSRMRDERQMACVYFDRRRSHSFGHETLKVGIDRPIFRRDRIEARLRTPGGVLCLAGQKGLVKRLLDRIEHPGLGFGHIAREIAQEGLLREPCSPSKTMPAEAGGVGNVAARAV